MPVINNNNAEGGDKHNEDELKAMVQIVLAIFISLTLVRFLAVFSFTYMVWATICVIAGVAIVYFSLRKKSEFDLFVVMTSLLAIPFAVMYNFVP